MSGGSPKLRFVRSRWQRLGEFEGGLGEFKLSLDGVWVEFGLCLDCVWTEFKRSLGEHRREA
ncbi:MAG: hypothetical protein ICV61_10200 [Microcoleus sp. Co-bin12]|nr:hypothetical protein [Microcoleus sp. Co-bin12]